MSKPLISLEELKQIISEVKPINIQIHSIDNDDYRTNDYIIVKDTVKIKILCPYIYNNDKNTKVIFKFDTDSDGFCQTYKVNYYDLVKPLKEKSYITQDDRREEILKVFNIKNKEDQQSGTMVVTFK